MNASEHRNAKRGHGLLRDAFTLIELLVVIVIIALLAALLLSAVGAAMRLARRTQALTEVKSMETAWKQYYTEYQAWPSFATETDPVVIEGQVVQMLKGENTGTNDNRRQLIFMDFKAGGTNDPLNPWNGKYFAKFDRDFDNKIAAGGAGVPPDSIVDRSVIVWTVDSNYPPENVRYFIKSW